MAIQMVELKFGPYFRLDGRKTREHIKITVEHAITDSTQVLFDEVEMYGAHEFSVSLPATDQEGLNWRYFTYTVTSGDETRIVALPGAVPVVNFDQLQPVKVPRSGTFWVPPFLAGEDGHTPTFSWNGTQLLIDNVAGPDLKGEKGDQGLFTAEWEGTALSINGGEPVELKGEQGDPGFRYARGTAYALVTTGRLHNITVELPFDRFTQAPHILCQVTGGTGQEERWIIKTDQKSVNSFRIWLISNVDVQTEGTVAIDWLALQ